MEKDVLADHSADQEGEARLCTSSAEHVRGSVGVLKMER